MEQAPVGPLTFRDLSEDEANDLLDRNHVGRIAYSFLDYVDIRPIHYVRSDAWLFGRTSPGDKLTTLRHNQWVAFEVDEIAGPLDWQSVVVHGTFRPLTPEGTAHDVSLYRRATDAVRSFYPVAFTEDDHLAFRTELFGIHIDSLSGRSCST